MPRMHSFLQAFLPLAAAGSGSWHLVDVQEVVCPGGSGVTEFTIPLPNISSSPYIFTIFRTSQQAVEIDFTATDAKGKFVTQQQIKLDSLPGRRLEEVPEEAPERQLSARRRGGSGSRGGGSSWSSPRRRSGGGSSFTGMRRRSPPASSSSFRSPRRRAVNRQPRYTAQRRRVVTNPSGSYNSRTGTNSFSNPINPTGGAYGYGSQGQLSSNYGGRAPMQTSYGYSGANAVRSGSSIPMALGGGLLAGALGGMVLGNLMHGATTHKHNIEALSMMNCTSGTWRGVCSECIKRFATTACSAEVSPSINISRDDLMNTGFMPNDFAGPITVKVTRLAGQDYGANVICPPAGWTASASNDTNATEANSTKSDNVTNATWTLPSTSNIFFALTKVDEVQDASSTQMSGSWRWSPTLAPALAVFATVLSQCSSS